MKGYKFVVLDGPSPYGGLPLEVDGLGTVYVKGLAAFVVAPTVTEAYELLRNDLAAHGDVPWASVASVIEVDLSGPSVALVVGNPPVIPVK